MALYSLKTKREIPWRDEAATFAALHAASTAAKFRNQMAEFERVMSIDLIAATESDCMAYAKWCMQQPGYRVHGEPSLVTRASVKFKLQNLKSICDHLQKCGYMQANPFISALHLLGKAEAGEKRQTEALTTEQVKKLMAGQADTQEGRRNLTLISLLFGAGLRISEALALTLGDICQTEEGLSFLKLRHTKAQKPQQHALQGWVGEGVQALKHQRLSEGAGAGMALITPYYSNGTAYQTPATYSAFLRWWKKWIRAAGLPATCTSHWGRATSITKLLSMGLDYRSVQEFSRHSTTRLVEMYDKRRFKLEDMPQKDLKY